MGRDLVVSLQRIAKQRLAKYLLAAEPFKSNCSVRPGQMLGRAESVVAEE
jgi:hypothetical protein